MQTRFSKTEYKGFFFIIIINRDVVNTIVLLDNKTDKS